MDSCKGHTGDMGVVGGQTHSADLFLSAGTSSRRWPRIICQDNHVGTYLMLSFHCSLRQYRPFRYVYCVFEILGVFSSSIGTPNCFFPGSNIHYSIEKHQARVIANINQMILNNPGIIQFTKDMEWLSELLIFLPQFEDSSVLGTYRGQKAFWQNNNISIDSLFPHIFGFPCFNIFLPPLWAPRMLTLQNCIFSFVSFVSFSHLFHFPICLFFNLPCLFCLLFFRRTFQDGRDFGQPSYQRQTGEDIFQTFPGRGHHLQVMLLAEHFPFASEALAR